MIDAKSTIEIAMLSPFAVLVVVGVVYFKEKSKGKYHFGLFSLIIFILVAALVMLLGSFAVVLVAFPTAQGPLSWVLMFGPFSLALGSIVGFVIWRARSLVRSNQPRN